MRPVRFHPEARLELRAAVRFYRDQSPGLGRALIAELRTPLDRVLEFPESGSPVENGVRRLLFPRFPFALVYRIDAEGVEVIAAMHQRRRPEYWRDRLD